MCLGCLALLGVCVCVCARFFSFFLALLGVCAFLFLFWQTKVDVFFCFVDQG